MARRKRFSADTVGRCGRCGRLGYIEWHHIRPLALGGKDEPGNIISLCEECHDAVHQDSRAEMIRAGMASAKNKPTEPLLSLYEVQAAIYRLFRESEGELHFDQVLNALLSCQFVRQSPADTNAAQARIKALHEEESKLLVFMEDMEDMEDMEE